MDYSYWRKQTTPKPLFPDIEWSKPVRKSQAGRLGIIGGNKLGFAAVAESYQLALDTGVGEVKVLLPDALSTTLGRLVPNCLFASTTPSGSLSTKAAPELKAIGDWSEALLLIGDAGRNSETAIAYEKFIAEYAGPLTITRDAIDLIKSNSSLLADRENTLIVASFAQLQKIFSGVYYPKILTFAMQLSLLVEALHKFTITYPSMVVTFHKNQLIMAYGGEVITAAYDNPLLIWRGTLATKIASYWLWNQTRPLESAAAAIASPPTA